MTKRSAFTDPASCGKETREARSFVLHHRVATGLFTVQIDDRRNHGKRLVVHSLTQTYLKDIETLLKGVV